MTDRLFTYGTLRPGQANAGMWPQGTISTAASTNGRIFYVDGSMAFPVFKPGGDEVVVGDLVKVNLRSPKVQDVLSMELGAGYCVQYILAWTHNEDPIEALAFTWPWQETGVRITGGDWAKRYQATTPEWKPRTFACPYHSADCLPSEPQWRCTRCASDLNGLDQCSGCGEWIAPNHLYDGLCWDCSPENVTSEMCEGCGTRTASHVVVGYRLCTYCHPDAALFG